MFSVFTFRVRMTREQMDDFGGMCFPFIKEPGYWFNNLRNNYEYYQFFPFWPLACALSKVYWYHNKLKWAIAWRWFKCHFVWVEDEKDSGMIPDLIAVWRPRFWPYDECVPEGDRTRWRDLVVYLIRRTKRVCRSFTAESRLIL